MHTGDIYEKVREQMKLDEILKEKYMNGDNRSLCLPNLRIINILWQKYPADG